MKAERRHQLQDNTLAKVITKAPTWWQESGGKMLAAALAVLLIVLLVRYRITSGREARAKAADNLATARAMIDQINQLSLMQMAPPQELAVRRKSFMNDASNAIAQAMRLSDDQKVQAEALIAKGDLNWALANQPVLQGAATQPSLQLGKVPTELIHLAAEAYQAVLNNYADLKHATVAARFGLAAIAENRGEWDAAKSHYEKIKSDNPEGGPFTDQADARLRALDVIRQPVVLAAPTTLPSLPGLGAGIPAPLTHAPAGPDFVIPPRPATTQAAPNPAVAATMQAATAPATQP